MSRGYQPEEPMVCMTRRWRGVDSNHQYRVTRQRFREGVISAPLDSPPTERQHEREPTPWRCRGPCAVLMVRIRLAPAASLLRTRIEPGAIRVFAINIGASGYPAN